MKSSLGSSLLTPNQLHTITMNRIIINNEAGISDMEALWLVLSVVKGGRVSDDGRKYCLCSTWKNAAVTVFSDQTKSGTDTFTITKQ